MKRKLSVLLVICLMLCARSTLTVRADSVLPDDIVSAGNLFDLEDPWVQMNEFGFANDMIVFLSVYEGMELEFDSAESLARMSSASVNLEANQFYSVRLVIMATIDESDLSKYDDVNLQFRFPGTLMAKSCNAFGYSVNGAKLQTWASAFGIRSDKDLDLYYIENSAEIRTLESINELTADGEDLLFGSGQGLPLQSIFTEAIEASVEIDDHHVSGIELSFVIFTTPHHGNVATADVALNHWVAQDLMREDITPAPEVSFAIATMNNDGAVSLAHDTSTTTETDKIARSVIGLLFGLLCIGVVYIVLKIRQAAHERGITGFRNIFLDFIDSNDSCGDDK